MLVDPKGLLNTRARCPSRGLGAETVFISSMGLLGISLLVSQQRVKEIGIRKVNGATISEILKMLNKNFIIFIVQLIVM